MSAERRVGGIILSLPFLFSELDNIVILCLFLAFSSFSFKKKVSFVFGGISWLLNTVHKIK